MSDAYFEITDKSDIIRIEPLFFTSDRHWLKTKVTVKGGVFSGQFVADFMPTDFESFKRQFKNLDNDFNATATFAPLEKQLALKIKGDGLGHFEVDCQATPEPHIGQTLTFSISFDQTEIKELVRQLDTITKAFPIDGDFKIHNE